MRLKDAPEVAAFRSEVRSFLENEIAPRWAPDDRRTYRTVAEERESVLSFNAALASRGWLAMAWPGSYGGRGATQIEQVVFHEELAEAGYSNANHGILWVGPSLIRFGTDRQRYDHLPLIAAGRELWCTLYSEPGAGSDLASLQTSAVLDGRDFVVNGQKIWTGGAHLADWGWLAVRTGQGGPKHRGITLLMVDMRSPGVVVRPLVNMAGRHAFNEVFFENVRVPVDNVVGEVDRGWYQLVVALDFERSGIAAFAAGRRTVRSLVALAKDRRACSAEGRATRLALAARWVELEVGRCLAYRVAGMQTAGLVPNHEASISRLFGAELSQRIEQTGMELLGTAGQVEAEGGDRAFPGEYIMSISATIAAGTSEIQRGIIATRGLGLPPSQS